LFERIRSIESVEIISKGRKIEMPKYVIEREIPNAGNLLTEELQTISQTSCRVLKK